MVDSVVLPLPVSRRRALALSCAGVAAGLSSHTARAAGGPRVALVVGNAAYAQAPLANPVRDARAMAGLLQDSGFEVIQRFDAPLQAMREAVAELRGRLAGRQGTGLLYFAGHGLQLNWRNHLVPVDARLESVADVPTQTMDVQTVIEAFQAAGNRMNIVVLDACRDNPFGAAAGGRGLAPVDAPPGTFLAYATAPGHLAEDGSLRDGHGLYTRFLLQELKRRDARIEDVFKRVRLQVRQASQGRQVPWESTSLEEDFVFSSGEKMQAPPARQRDAEFDAERADWDRIARSERAEDFYDFLQRHPNGRVAEQAQFRLDQLSRPAVQPEPARRELKTLPPGADRFRVGDEADWVRTDHLQGDLRQQLSTRVTSIDNGLVLVNRGLLVFDQMGGILRNRFGSKSPALMAVPAELQLGRRWRTAYVNTMEGRPPVRSYYDARVAAVEEIEVPAGRFVAYRIEMRGEARWPGGTRDLRLEVWVEPATLLQLRQHVIQHDPTGRVVEHTTDELVARRLAPRG